MKDKKAIKRQNFKDKKQAFIQAKAAYEACLGMDSDEEQDTMDSDNDEGSKVLHEPDGVILLHDGEDRAVVPAAGWLNDSELEPFEDVSFDFFPVRVGNLELFHINWFFGF